MNSDAKMPCIAAKLKILMTVSFKLAAHELTVTKMRPR